MRGSTTAPSAPERWREKGEVVPAFMLWHNPVQPPITIAKAVALSWSSWMKSQCLSKQNWFIWGTIVLSHISDHMRSWLWAWLQHVLQIWTGEHVLRGTGVCVLPDAGSWVQHGSSLAEIWKGKAVCSFVYWIVWVMAALPLVLARSVSIPGSASTKVSSHS